MKKIRPLYFLKLLKFQKRKYLHFVNFWPPGIVIFKVKNQYPSDIMRFQVVVRPSYAAFSVWVSALHKIQFMKWPLRNSGATYPRDITNIVQSVHYSDSQCTVYTATILARASTLQLVACRALLYSTTTFYTVRVLFCHALREFPLIHMITFTNNAYLASF